MDFAAWQRSKLLLDMGRPKDALRHLADLLRSFPNDHYAHYLSAYAHIQLGAHAMAYTHLKSALAGVPEHPAYQILLANLHSITGDHRSGLEVINNALRSDPENADLHSTHGALLMRSSRFPEADIALKRALELNPEHIHALQMGAFNAGVLHGKDEARTLIHTAARQDPSNARTLAGLAWNDFLNSNPGDHAAGFRYALSKDPNESLARLGLRLSSAWLPRYQAWAQRTALRVHVKNETQTASMQLVSILLMTCLVACWAVSGWRWDIGISIPFAFLAVPFLVMVGLPTLLQAPLFFSSDGRALFKEERPIRAGIIASLTLAACALLITDILSTSQLVFPAVLCLLCGLVVNKIHGGWKKLRRLTGICLMLAGSTLMGWAGLTMTSGSLLIVVLTLGASCIMISYIILADEIFA